MLLFKSKTTGLFLIVSCISAFSLPLVFKFGNIPLIALALGLTSLPMLHESLTLWKRAKPNFKKTFSLLGLIGLVTCTAVGMVGIPLLVNGMFYLMTEKPLADSLQPILILAGGLYGALLFCARILKLKANENQSPDQDIAN